MFDITKIQSLITENWRIISIGVAVLSYFGWDKAKALLGNIKVPQLGKTPVVVDHKSIEAADIAAISLLRDRAVASKNETLLKEIKNVSGQFFDLHCDPNRVNNKSI
jgi:hypothetical protein